MGECDILWVPFVWGDLGIIHHPVMREEKENINIQRFPERRGDSASRAQL